MFYISRKKLPPNAMLLFVVFLRNINILNKLLKRIFLSLDSYQNLYLPEVTDHGTVHYEEKGATKQIVLVSQNWCLIKQGKTFNICATLLVSGIDFYVPAPLIA